MTLDVGSTIIIDGRALTVASISGTVARALDEQQKAVYFNATEARYLGASLFGLPGRIEPPAPSAPSAEGVVVAGTAVASAR